MKKDIGYLRKIYKKGTLDMDSVGNDPIIFFKKWFDEAQLNKEIDEPNAFNISTISNDGFPVSRIVLLKSFDAEGFVFYTNYDSNKGKQIINNPQVCMSFFWPSLERQIIIKGFASKTDDISSDIYFESRPLGSKLGAIVSNQSSAILNREILEDKLNKLKNTFKSKLPKRPNNWGGFKISGISYEFWQGRENRLHDRILFEKIKDKWIKKRLSP